MAFLLWMHIPDDFLYVQISSFEDIGQIGLWSSRQMVIAAMKLKDAYSLEEKLWPT